MAVRAENIGSFQYSTERKWTKRIENLINYIHDVDPGLCIERGRLVTEAYRENEAEPTMIKRAKALEKILENMTIYILPGSLLVGNQASKPKWAPLFPEFAVTWLEEEIFEGKPYDPEERPADPFIIPDREKTLPELKEIFDYWRGRTHMDRVYSYLPEEVKIAQDKFGAINEYNYIQGGDGHFIPDHGYLIRTGLRKLIDDCVDKLAALDKTAPDYHEKREFYQSLVISLEAVIRWAHRYNVIYGLIV